MSETWTWTLRKKNFTKCLQIHMIVGAKIPRWPFDELHVKWWIWRQSLVFWCTTEEEHAFSGVHMERRIRVESDIAAEVRHLVDTLDSERTRVFVPLQGYQLASPSSGRFCHFYRRRRASSRCPSLISIVVLPV